MTKANVKLNSVYHVPTLTGSLLSNITDEGFTVACDKNCCKIMKDGAVKVVDEPRGGLYFLPEAKPSETDDDDNRPYEKAITRIIRNQLRNGIFFQRCDISTICGTCCEVKMARSARSWFPKVSERRSEAGDLSGPFEVPTPSGNQYSMVLILDDI